MVYDMVVQKNFDFVFLFLFDNIDEDFDEEFVKIVCLVKNKEFLGVIIWWDEYLGVVVVVRIM